MYREKILISQAPPDVNRLPVFANINGKLCILQNLIFQPSLNSSVCKSTNFAQNGEAMCRSIQSSSSCVNLVKSNNRSTIPVTSQLSTSYSINSKLINDSERTANKILLPKINCSNESSMVYTISSTASSVVQKYNYFQCPGAKNPGHSVNENRIAIFNSETNVKNHLFNSEKTAAKRIFLDERSLLQGSPTYSNARPDSTRNELLREKNDFHKNLKQPKITSVFSLNEKKFEVCTSSTLDQSQPAIEVIDISEQDDESDPDAVNSHANDLGEKIDDKVNDTGTLSNKDFISRSSKLSNVLPKPNLDMFFVEKPSAGDVMMPVLDLFDDMSPVKDNSKTVDAMIPEDKEFSFESQLDTKAKHCSNIVEELVEKSASTSNSSELFAKSALAPSVIDAKFNLQSASVPKYECFSPNSKQVSQFSNDTALQSYSAMESNLGGSSNKVTTSSVSCFVKQNSAPRTISSATNGRICHKNSLFPAVPRNPITNEKSEYFIEIGSGLTNISSINSEFEKDASKKDVLCENPLKSPNHFDDNQVSDSPKTKLKELNLKNCYVSLERLDLNCNNWISCENVEKCAVKSIDAINAPYYQKPKMFEESCHSVNTNQNSISTKIQNKLVEDSIKTTQTNHEPFIFPKDSELIREGRNGNKSLLKNTSDSFCGKKKISKADQILCDTSNVTDDSVDFQSDCKVDPSCSSIVSSRKRKYCNISPPLFRNDLKTSSIDTNKVESTEESRRRTNVSSCSPKLKCSLVSLLSFSRGNERKLRNIDRLRIKKATSTCDDQSAISTKDINHVERDMSLRNNSKYVTEAEVLEKSVFKSPLSNKMRSRISHRKRNSRKSNRHSKRIASFLAENFPEKLSPSMENSRANVNCDSDMPVYPDDLFETCTVSSSKIRICKISSSSVSNSIQKTDFEKISKATFFDKNNKSKSLNTAPKKKDKDLRHGKTDLNDNHHAVDLSISTGKSHNMVEKLYSKSAKATLRNKKKKKKKKCKVLSSSCSSTNSDAVDAEVSTNISHEINVNSTFTIEPKSSFSLISDKKNKVLKKKKKRKTICNDDKGLSDFQELVKNDDSNASLDHLSKVHSLKTSSLKRENLKISSALKQRCNRNVCERISPYALYDNNHNFNKSQSGMADPKVLSSSGLVNCYVLVERLKDDHMNYAQISVSKSRDEIQGSFKHGAVENKLKSTSSELNFYSKINKNTSQDDSILADNFFNKSVSDISNNFKDKDHCSDTFVNMESGNSNQLDEDFIKIQKLNHDLKERLNALKGIKLNS